MSGCTLCLTDAYTDVVVSGTMQKMSILNKDEMFNLSNVGEQSESFFHFGFGISQEPN